MASCKLECEFYDNSFGNNCLAFTTTNNCLKYRKYKKFYKWTNLSIFIKMGYQFDELNELVKKGILSKKEEKGNIYYKSTKG